jgi:hypothetical protein
MILSPLAPGLPVPAQRVQPKQISSRPPAVKFGFLLHTPAEWEMKMDLWRLQKKTKPNQRGRRKTIGTTLN